jgi:hypothetical protein
LRRLSAKITQAISSLLSSTPERNFFAKTQPEFFVRFNREGGHFLSLTYSHRFSLIFVALLATVESAVERGGKQPPGAKKARKCRRTLSASWVSERP